MERDPVRVDPAAIQAWFEELARQVDGVPRGFVFNVDETGCSNHTHSDETRDRSRSPTIGTAKGLPSSRASLPMDSG
jgi:hypothetical protein